MTLKNDEKSEEEFTWRFKTDIRNLTSFDLRIGSLKNLHFNGLLLIKLYNVWAKKRRGEEVILGVSSEELHFMTLECDETFEEKLNCGLENDMRNFTNFHQSTRKSQNWGFHLVLLYKVEIIWASKL